MRTLLLLLLASPCFGQAIYYHADWCAPCKPLTATMRRWKAAGHDVVIRNFDQHRAIAKASGVNKIPAMVDEGQLYQGTEQTDQMLNALSRRATVKVQTATGSGTGWVWKPRWVVTAAHVIRGEMPTVDGKRVTFVDAHPSMDVGLMYVPDLRKQPIRSFPKPVPLGRHVRLTRWTGVEVTGRVLQNQHQFSQSTRGELTKWTRPLFSVGGMVADGTSGGPVFDSYWGGVCGTVHAKDRSGNATQHSLASDMSALQGWLATTQAKGLRMLTAPVSVTVTPSPVRERPMVPTNQPDHDACQQWWMRYIDQQITRRIQGLPVTQGPQGPQGPPGNDGRTPTDAQIEAIAVRWLEAHKHELKGPDGPKGNPGEPGFIDRALIRSIVLEILDASETPERSHFTLVADKTAAYWPRMKGEYEQAEDAYSMRLLDKPAYPIGELPGLVYYENRVPIKQWRGQRNVSNALNKIARGEASDLIGED